MATTNARDHEKFCRIDGWEPVQNARGSGARDHKYYRKILTDGQVLQTKISHGSGKKTYGDGLFKMIWKDQLMLGSPDEYYNAIRNRQEVARTPQSPDVAPLHSEEIPDWLKIQLTKTVGLDSRDLEALSPSEAQEYWDVFCGIEEIETDRPTLVQDDVMPEAPKPSMSFEESFDDELVIGKSDHSHQQPLRAS